MKHVTAFFFAAFVSAGIACAATPTSVSHVTFGPSSVLFASDWKAGRVYAFRLPKATLAPPDRPFNLLDLRETLSRAVGSTTYRVRDFAMRPGTNDAYVALEIGTTGKAAIVRVNANGDATALDLAGTPSTSTALVKAGGTLKFWDRLPETAYTVTDMKWHAGRLYVAGLANQNFSSTLRVLGYPFGSQTMSSIEMYHTVHNQVETRAPIRAMTFVSMNGTDTLLAGYLCSPLVSIPVAKLKDGAHVRGKTLAELGVSGIPSSMTAYDQPDQSSGRSFPFVLITERYRPSVAISLAALARVNAGEGITSPPNMMAPAGANVGAIVESFDGVLAMANQSSKFFIALRRDLDTGAPQLVSFDKRASFRLSDADVSDYDFPQYVYRGKFQRGTILPLQNMLKTEEGYPDLVIPAKP